MMEETEELELVNRMESSMQTNSNKHPKGLYVLFVTEMWERFSYYGMRALFTLFMIKGLLFDKAFASEVYGNYTGLVYLTPLLGGYVADKYWGNRRSILVGGIMMAIGQFCLFGAGMFYNNLAAATPFFYGGLGLLILGNGFFKPNISTMVGQLYPPADKRVDAAFTIFYMGINLGAFLAPLVCGTLGDTGNPADFKWGFLSAGIGMVVSTIFFELTKNKYVVTPEGKAVGMPPKFNNADLSAEQKAEADKPLTKEEKERIGVIFIISAFVIFFWAAFEQAGASLTFFAEEQTNRELFGKTIPTAYFQSINAVAIVILAPVMAALWIWLGKRNAEPSSPIKQAMGLFLLAIGYLVIAFGVKGIDASTKVSMMWLVGLYLIHTLGELCLSPIGLSMVVKLSPAKFASLLMGVWFLSTAAANKFAGTLSAYYPETMLKVETLKEAQTKFNVVLSEKLDKTSEYQVFNGENFVSIDLISLEKVKDNATKDAVKAEIFKGSLIKDKSFLGFHINSLYSFFMLFVVMAGLSSIILFLISSKLLKMMHGVR